MKATVKDMDTVLDALEGQDDGLAMDDILKRINGKHGTTWNKLDASDVLCELVGNRTLTFELRKARNRKMVPHYKINPAWGGGE